MRRLSPSKKAWLCSFCLMLGLSLVATAAPKTRIVMKKPQIDPQAETVELFDGITQGLLDVHLVPHNADGGNVFIANKTDRPLTVKLPKAVAAVQVLKQGRGGRAAGVGPGIGLGAINGANGANNGGAQATAGGFGQGVGVGAQNNRVGNFMQPGGLFSVAPEQVAQLPLKTVCLEHGKPDPRSSMTYQLVPIERHSSDPVLAAMLEQFVAGKIDQKAAQAAAWHLANHMSWKELAAKQIKHLGGVAPTPYFKPAQLTQAQELVGKAERAVRDRAADPKPASLVSSSSPGPK